jgi:tRNA wybutosine-synthesizing protein 1
MGDTWDNIKRSLEIIGDSKTRTAIRITLTKGVNMISPNRYADLIGLAKPDYVELKSYMHLGFSRRRLTRDNMPSHKEVLDFSKMVAHALDYSVADDSGTSRVVLLSKDGTKRRIV